MRKTSFYIDILEFYEEFNGVDENKVKIFVHTCVFFTFKTFLNSRRSDYEPIGNRLYDELDKIPIIYISLREVC